MENDNIEILEDNNKKKGSKRPYVIAIVMALLLVVTITATSYAYFTANVSGTGQNNVVTTTSLEIEFTDGPQVALENAVPGQYIEKTFKVENKGSGDTPYDIYMSEVINDFADKTDLVYTLTSSDGGANVAQTQIPDTNTKIVNSYLLRAGETHNYVLRITFKETNDNQDDNKGKQFSTIIRVNEVKDAVPPTIATTIEALVSGGDSTSTDEIGDTGLAYDGTEDNNLRYVGANPNNYVSFNNELWRIIGVMNNIETEGGETQSLVKIRRAESLGNYSWDTSASGVNGGYGINQWGASTYKTGTTYDGADLMRELNYDYLGNIVVGIDGKWYSGPYETNYNQMPTSVLNTTTISKIETVVWKLGLPNYNNGTMIEYLDDSLKASFVYYHERNNLPEQICTESEMCNDSVVRKSTWTGKVGLIYPSDYLYATSGGNTINRETCLNTKQSDWGETTNQDCKNNDWLLDSINIQPSISPCVGPNHGFIAFCINSNGSVISNATMIPGSTYPTLFLKSSISITGGEGTSSNPYTIG